ncbi:hypothetical protein [Cohnella sp. GbtcB17]|uniref:hypothetical protein n=1 Tax=Cohnella sp. GbtcB17 TaxID=2824762 RepID=UPI001C2F8F2D|nr:hypothetical protein [Cohnella sp. GbtcB17]
MESSTDKPRDLDADLMLCAEASILTIQTQDVLGRMVKFAADAINGWPYAIRRAKAAEDENDKLREENAMLQEQMQQLQRSHCYD